VYSAEARFLRPVPYDEMIEITTALADSSGVRLAFTYELRRENDQETLARARTDHAAVDETGRPRRLPEDILSLLK
jgi:acyl-CoA thioester hydrolase